MTWRVATLGIHFEFLGLTCLLNMLDKSGKGVQKILSKPAYSMVTGYCQLKGLRIQ